MPSGTGREFAMRRAFISVGAVGQRSVQIVFSLMVLHGRCSVRWRWLP